jgi:hypothetical protein
MPPSRSRPPARVDVIQYLKRLRPKGEPLSEANPLQLGVLPLLNRLTVEGASMKRHQPVILSMWTFPPMRICQAAILNLCVVLLYALFDGHSNMCYRLDQNGRLLSKIQMKERDVAMLLLPIKAYLLIGLPKDPVKWTRLRITGLLID